MMDVSVSHLNSRLALQLPAELPLGLVFVVGEVQNLAHDDGETEAEADTTFDLVETDYLIHCRLTSRAASSIALADGVQVRTGGHLTFNGRAAGYYLLVRDIELVQQDDGLLEPDVSLDSVSDEIEALAAANEALAASSKEVVGRQALTPALADIKRRADSVRLAPAELPYWVKEIAPASVQSSWDDGKKRGDQGQASGKPTETAVVNEKLVRVFDAMEAGQEVELTPDMIAVLSPSSVQTERQTAVPQRSPYQVPAERVAATAEPAVAQPTEPQSESFSIFVLVMVLFLILFLIVIGLFAFVL